jgi:sec-independent protein translocase protein TatA
MLGLGIQELIIVGVVALLLFGKRLPEVARNLGKSYNEFRRGLQDIQSHMSDAYYSSTSSPSYSSPSSYSPPSSSSTSSGTYDDYEQATAPKFEPPPAESPDATAAVVPPAQASGPESPAQPPQLQPPASQQA